jgi:hypothetical protein
VVPPVCDARFVALIRSFIGTIVSGLHQPIDARSKTPTIFECALNGCRGFKQASGNGHFTILVPNSLLEIGSFARDVCNHVLT